MKIWLAYKWACSTSGICLTDQIQVSALSTLRILPSAFPVCLQIYSNQDGTICLRPNLFLCSPVSPEVGKSSASECEYDRRDCDQLQMVEDKLQYTACHVNNPLQYSLPRQQPVRAFRLSPASKLHTRRAAFPKKAEITSCGKHSLPVCTLLGVQHQRWWHQQTENTDRQGRLCDCLLKFEAVVQRRWLNKLLSNTDHPEHPLHHFLDWQLSTFSNRQMQDTGNLSDLMQ